MPRLAVIQIHKEELKFSAGHFMIITHEHRETMHGHDYQVQVAFKALILHNGMAFDCRIYKKKLLELCQLIDYHFILPAHSSYLQLTETASQCIAKIGEDTFPFYKKDCIILPICNVTIEELSNWFLQQLLQNTQELAEHQIQEITVTVFNGRGESGSTHWSAI